MAEATRICLQTPDGQYRPVFWVKSNKAGEMLLGIYGLRSKQPILRSQWPDELVPADAPVLRKYWHFAGLEMNIPIDHISCHADGTFHVKTRDGSAAYIHTLRRTNDLGADTHVFLEFALKTAIADSYLPVAVKPKRALVLPTDGSSYASIWASFSGKNYPLSDFVSKAFGAYDHQAPEHLLDVGTFAGALVTSRTPKDPSLKNVPNAVLLSFRFPHQSGGWLLKTFSLE